MVSLLPEAHVSNGVTLNVFGWQAATVVGPALGGALLAVTSPDVVYGIDALSFFAMIGALLAIRPPAAPRPDGGAARAELRLGAALEALRFLRDKPILVWLMLLDFVATLLAGSLLLLPVFAGEIFHVGAAGLGLLAASPAAGAVLASAWLSLRRPIQRQGIAVVGAIIVYGASVAAFGLARQFSLGLVLLAISGAADTVSTVVRQVVRQTQTPDALRGRMTAVNMVFFIGGPQLGEVEAGIVAHVTSARASVVSGGIACVVMAALAGALLPSLFRLQRSDARPAA
jgi:MFS family permease